MVGHLSVAYPQVGLLQGYFDDDRLVFDEIAIAINETFVRIVGSSGWGSKLLPIEQLDEQEALQHLVGREGLHTRSDTGDGQHGGSALAADGEVAIAAGIGCQGESSVDASILACERHTFRVALHRHLARTCQGDVALQRKDVRTVATERIRTLKANNQSRHLASDVVAIAADCGIDERQRLCAHVVFHLAVAEDVVLVVARHLRPTDPKRWGLVGEVAGVGQTAVDAGIVGTGAGRVKMGSAAAYQRGARHKHIQLTVCRGTRRDKLFAGVDGGEI